MAEKTFRTGVFVSYSHKDKEWLEKLRIALAPLILWIPVRYSAYDRTALREIQAAHDPSKPLAGLPASQQDEAFVQIADRVAAAADINALANALKIVDDFYPQLEAFIKGQPEPAVAAEHAVLAVQEGEKITFESSVYPQEVVHIGSSINLICSKSKFSSSLTKL